MLQSLGSQRIIYDLATEQKQLQNVEGNRHEGASIKAETVKDTGFTFVIFTNSEKARREGYKKIQK